MADQIVLAWDVSIANSSFGTAGAATALGAVELYLETEADPVLGQLFGLTVASDVSAPSGPTTARRTLTLNMTAAGAAAAEPAPPMFQCRPRPEVSDVDPPYLLRRNVTLPGSFFVENGLATVPTTATQIPSLSVGDRVQFLSQQGVFYQILAITATQITLTFAYTGTTANTSAFKEVQAPVTIAAIYSTSPLDTNGVATTPAIPAGPGARTISLTYRDSTGAGPFTVVVPLTGKRPAPVTLAGGINIARIDSMVVASTGGFTNSVGQITLVELSEAPAALPATPTREDFRRLTDETQLTISRHLVYLPPSYFALTRQASSAPALAGDFFVTTGSRNVSTSESQVGVLAPGDVIQFASQLTINSPLGTIEVFYTVEFVGPRNVRLTTAYTGIDENFTGSGNVNSNIGTKGNLGSEVLNKATGAFKISPSLSAPPSNAQLRVLLGQIANADAEQVAMPPPSPPLPPETVPVPVLISDFFTQTLQLALSGVPITPQPITILP